MAFLTALLGAAGGFGQGRLQRQQTDLDKQRQADTHAYEQAQTDAERAHVGIEQQEEAAKQQATQRNLGIDPTTGKPFVIPKPLMQVAPNNKGRAATPEQLYQHYSNLARYYVGTGQTDAANLAAQQASEIQRQMISQNQLNMRQILDIYNQGQQNQRFSTGQSGLLERLGIADAVRMAITGMQQGGATGRTIYNNTQEGLRQDKSIAAANARSAASIAQRYMAQSDNDLRQMQTQNDEATKTGKTMPHPELADFKRNLAGALSAVTTNPKLLPTILKQFEAHVTDSTLLIHARRQLENAAHDAQQQQGVPLLPVGSGPKVTLPPPRLPPG